MSVMSYRRNVPPHYRAAMKYDIPIEAARRLYLRQMFGSIFSVTVGNASMFAAYTYLSASVPIAVGAAFGIGAIGVLLTQHFTAKKLRQVQEAADDGGDAAG